MNYHVLTLFPEMILQGLNTSIIGRAIEKGILSLEAVNIRDYAGNALPGKWTIIPMAAEPAWSCRQSLSMLAVKDL